MSDESETPGQVEALRLEVERARLTLDQANYLNQQTRTFLERWRTDVQPLHETLEHSREMAYGFAKMAIQTMFLLNGGALIAFPAFAQLVGTGFKEHVAWALLSIGAFVFGLVLIAITTLLAYLSMYADAEAVQQREEAVKATLNRFQSPNDKKAEYDKVEAEAERARKSHYDRAVRLRTWTLRLGVGSTVVFVLGAICAARVLSAA